MSKYQKLWEYIHDNNTKELSFSNIQSILGFPIEHSILTYKKELLGCEIDVG